MFLDTCRFTAHLGPLTAQALPGCSLKKLKKAPKTMLQPSTLRVVPVPLFSLCCSCSSPGTLRTTSIRKVNVQMKIELLTVQKKFRNFFKEIDKSCAKTAHNDKLQSKKAENIADFSASFRIPRKQPHLPPPLF